MEVQLYGPDCDEFGYPDAESYMPSGAGSEDVKMENRGIEEALGRVREQLKDCPPEHLPIVMHLIKKQWDVFCQEGALRPIRGFQF